MLDLVKAFDHVPHDILAECASRAGYPLHLLRLSIAAYRLGRVLAASNLVTRVVHATRGIVAGAVHATVELRALLLQVADSVVSRFRAPL